MRAGALLALAKAGFEFHFKGSELALDLRQACSCLAARKGQHLALHPVQQARSVFDQGHARDLQLFEFMLIFAARRHPEPSVQPARELLVNTCLLSSS